MRELPMLFSTPMVQAIQENRKTMTRRTNGLEPMNIIPENWTFLGCDEHNIFRFFNEKANLKTSAFPHYRIGEHIWVKETWSDWEHAIKHTLKDDVKMDPKIGNTIIYKADTAFPANYKWKSSLFMKKINTRIWLEVTKVRCERLQSISQEDAVMEGVKYVYGSDFVKHFDYETGVYTLRYPTHSFFTLWRKINGKDSVAANPWVFVYEFKMIKKQQ